MQIGSWLRFSEWFRECLPSRCMWCKEGHLRALPAMLYCPCTYRACSWEGKTNINPWSMRDCVAAKWVRRSEGKEDRPGLAIHTGSWAGPGVVASSLPQETGLGWQRKDEKALIRQWARSRQKKQHVQRQEEADSEAALCAEPRQREQRWGGGE